MASRGKGQGRFTSFELLRGSKPEERAVDARPGNPSLGSLWDGVGGLHVCVHVEVRG